MQVLVLAAQNAVDEPRSASRLGIDPVTADRGLIGVALFGTIFINWRHTELRARFPAGVRRC